MVPIFALSELVKREPEQNKEKTIEYFKVLLGIFVFWLLSVPFWKMIMVQGMGIQEPDRILSILALLVPFYIAYGISTVFSSECIACGKTHITAAAAFVVNVGYYGIMYILFRYGIFQPTVSFVCCLFGGGMIVSAVFYLIIYFFRFRRNY